MAIRTVGELRSALAGLPDDMPLQPDFDGRSNAIHAKVRLRIGPKGKRGAYWTGGEAAAMEFAEKAWPGREVAVVEVLMIEGC